MNPAVISTELGSVTVLVRGMAVPSGLVAGAPLIATVGATFATVTVKVAVPKPGDAAESVTFTVTVYVPLSGKVWFWAVIAPSFAV